MQATVEPGKFFKVGASAENGKTKFFDGDIKMPF
jgi:hypothetical protein